jgi:hypothetical protein
MQICCFIKGALRDGIKNAPFLDGFHLLKISIISVGQKKKNQPNKVPLETCFLTHTYTHTHRRRERGRGREKGERSERDERTREGQREGEEREEREG